MNQKQYIRHQEGIVQQGMDALELCAFIQDKQSLLDNIVKEEDIFAKTASILQKILPLEAHAFFIINAEDNNLIFHHCQPVHLEKYMNTLLEKMIENGNVAWAMRENRIVTSQSKDKKFQVILHAVTTREKTHGIFVALIKPDSVIINYFNSILFSILIKSTAFAYENFILYSKIDRQNEELSQVIAKLNQEVYKRDKVEKELRHSEALHRNVFENTGNPTIIVDKDGLITLANSQFINLSGFDRCDLIRKKRIYDFLKDQEFSQGMMSLMACIYKSNGQGKEEFRFYDKNHEQRHVLLYAYPLGTDNSLIISLSDISRIKVIEERLNFQAYHDPLTHLPNRAFFKDRLQMAISKSVVDPKYNYAVVFIDIDRLKTINDTMGHTAGDTMIVIASQKINHSIRDVDTLARFGGDEFVILVEGVKGKHDCELVMQRVYSEFNKPVNIQDKEILMTLSSGIFLGTKTPLDSDDVIRCADMAMYQAKQKGRNQYEYYDPKETGIQEEKLHLEHDLMHALSKEEIYLQYQPIVNLQTGRLFALEALMRWKHPRLGNIPPGQFIPIAENTGLINSLGQKLFDLAFRQFMQLLDKYPQINDVNLAINMSVKQLSNIGLINEIKASADKYGFALNKLHLEITESVFLDHNKANEHIIKYLNDLGITIAIDDFGTGYSSLNYLNQFSINAVKIDKSLIYSMINNEKSHSIVESMINLAQKMNLDIVAEGIEDKQQLLMLQELKCQLGQGFYFFKPMSIEHVCNMLNHTLQHASESLVLPGAYGQ